MHYIHTSVGPAFENSDLEFKIFLFLLLLLYFVVIIRFYATVLRVILRLVKSLSVCVAWGVFGGNRVAVSDPSNVTGAIEVSTVLDAYPVPVYTVKMDTAAVPTMGASTV